MARPEEEDQAIEWWRARLGRVSEGADALGSRATDHLASLRTRVTLIDVGVRVYERDKEAAGTLLGSALALRMFLFMVPLVLAAVGLAGLLGRSVGVDSVSSSAGITGTVATEIDRAFAQSGRSSWIGLLLGLYFMAWAGRSLTRALVLSSALGWELGGNQKTPFRLVGVVVGVIVGSVFVWAILNRIRLAAGLALASISFVAVAGVYVLLWSLLFLALPRATNDPGAALPGATLVALTLTALQAISMLYLPGAVSNTSALYGSLGVAVSILGWFFFIGRSLSFAFAMNAAVYERLGSLSQVIFGLPVLRLVPARFSGVARFFDLPDAADDVEPEGAEPPAGS